MNRTLKRFRKLIATVMTLVMMLGLTSVFARADVTYPYLTTANGTNYTTVVTTTTQTLSVQKYGSDWATYPFSEDELSKVSWTWPYGGSENFTTVADSQYVDDDEYYSTLNIAAKSNANIGAYTIRATFTDGAANPYIDLTVVVAASSAQTASVTVKVDGSNTIDSNTFTATKSAFTASSGSYNYATPLTALTAMQGTTAGTNIYGYTASSGYVSAISGYKTANNIVTKTANYNTGYGWQYRVYHLTNGTYTRDDSSELIAADTYKLSDNDYVMWYYGNYSGATSYFPASFSAN